MKSLVALSVERDREIKGGKEIVLGSTTYVL